MLCRREKGYFDFNKPQRASLTGNAYRYMLWFRSKSCVFPLHNGYYQTHQRLSVYVQGD